MFEVEKLIRFHHCDPAGIVFFPQYLVLCHEVIEDWIEHGIEIGTQPADRAAWHASGAAADEYLARSSLVILPFRLGVRKLGNSSDAVDLRRPEGRGACAPRSWSS
jgi:4-hydroxybenzoyl-CoA thioesterase